MDWRFALLHGALCVVAVVFAAHARGERGSAVLLALLMTTGWALYVAAWTRANPAAILARAGVPLANKDLWAIEDATRGALALALAWHTRWGRLLYALALVACILHVLNMEGWFADFDAYSRELDKVLLGQIALFILIGGRGVADRVSHLADRGRHVLRAARSTSRQAARR